VVSRVVLLTWVPAVVSNHPQQADAPAAARQRLVQSARNRTAILQAASAALTTQANLPAFLLWHGGMVSLQCKVWTLIIAHAAAQETNAGMLSPRAL